jgi:LuxR family maltose regulon positive regulatory protein
LRAGGEVEAATQAFEEARDAATRHGDLSGVIYSACNLGLLRQATGDLKGAEATYREAIARAQTVGGDELPITGMALAGLANVLRERNALQPAAELAAAAHRLGVLGNYGDIVTEALLVQARISRADGSAAGARASVDEAASIVERQHVTSRVASELVELRMRLLIELDDRRAAAALAPLPSPGLPVFERYPEWLALARLAKAEGKFEGAVSILANLRRSDERAGRWGSALKALTLEVLCLDGAGRTDEALVALAQALDLAAAGGWVRVLADEGFEMAQFLAKFVVNADTRFSSAAVAYARRILATITPTEHAAAPAAISPRELEILRLMATGQSNVEIATALVVTHATVKTHVNNLYRKLDARNRVQALERARQLGLLR